MAHTATPAAQPAAGLPKAPRESLVDRVASRLAGARGPHQGDYRLTQRNVYVLPTRPGLLYGTILLAMLVGSVNYSLSLGYMLTFLLGAVALVAMLHTFRNLATLVLRPGRAEPVFAGQHAEFSLVLVNPGRLERFALRLAVPGMAQPETVDLAPSAEQLARIAVPTHRRGRMQIPRVKLWAEYPLGLWRVWAYWRPAMSVLVYPTPEPRGVPLPASSARAGDGDGAGGGEEDVAAVRPYQPGDSPRRIAWRAVARTGSDELLTKQFEGSERGELLLDWDRLPAHLDTEARLSRLARWVIDADAAGARFALRIPGASIALDGGGAHRERCLEALALAQV
ncbi:MAG TPA: DUF58 domain-containing protein [Burkholderiaceae bacterium]